MCEGGGSKMLQLKVEIPEQLEKKKYKRARRNDKLVVGSRRLYKRNMREDGEVEKYKCRLVT